jgi:hypothetical protein
MITISGRGCALSAFTKSMAQSVGGRQISLPLTSLLSDSLERQELLPQLIPNDFQWISINPQLNQTFIPKTHYSINNSLIRRQLTVGTGISGNY